MDNFKYTDEQLIKIALEHGENGLIYIILPTRAETAHILNTLVKEYDEKFDWFKDEIYNSDDTEWLNFLRTQLNDLELNHIEYSERILELTYTLFESKYYYQLKNLILENLKSKKLTGVLMQTFTAYESNLFYPCLCASFPILENILKDNDDLTNTSLLKLYDSIINNQEKDLETTLLVHGVRGFVNHITKRIDFSDTEPLRINRHWFLHGRSEHTVQKADCLKLFVAIASLLEILNLYKCCE